MGLWLASFLALLWIAASAASRGQGFWLFAAGCVGLGLALDAARRGRRRPLLALYFGVLMAAVAGLAFEALLRVAPGVLAGHVANVAYSGYHWQKGGIYALDDHLGPVIRPNVRREMYWSGHWWQHDANADGYRGPAVTRADVVFLGDSMVYGHGVETAETLAARFAARTGLAVANLGQQGTCLLQSWMRFERLGTRLTPKVVFACAHFTDVDDAVQWYAPGELERFLASPQESPAWPVARPQYRPRPWWDPVSFWARHVALPLRCAGVPGAVARALRGRGPELRAGPAARWEAPSATEIEAPLDPARADAPREQRLGWAVQSRSVRQLHRTCDALGARLVLFDLGYPRAFSQATEQLARDAGADYSPAGRVALQRALAGPPIYLRDDGHWTPEGHDVIAAELQRALGR